MSNKEPENIIYMAETDDGRAIAHLDGKPLMNNEELIISQNVGYDMIYRVEIGRNGKTYVTTHLHGVEAKIDITGAKARRTER